MKKQSAGILLYKKKKAGQRVEVLLVHPGGPFWAKKDAGAWSIPKGEFEEDEEPLAAAKREFSEELGLPVPAGDVIALGMAKQSGGKVVHAWAVAGTADPKKIQSNVFSMEWPPKSGKTQEFPEVDKAAWFFLDKAVVKIVKGQVSLLTALADYLGQAAPEAAADKGPSQTALF